ncbi:cytochrome P450 [Glutamicibacter sp. MNS18]|uniref:cytochrome P450 n=1 Tax=Glutamicibacter sp. MNS18 TaxID=2989817 RepID=UPI0022354851|nr:cytochrome P450 [Glutamicibacter sp. MNS18]MCW4466927.1 cytochrome P450 [Glutamicibacter sp. MNS18]
MKMKESTMTGTTNVRPEILRIETADNQQPMPVPVADWVTIEQLQRDSNAVYTRLLRESPVAWVPVMGRIMISPAAACIAAEQNPEVFSSEVGGAHMVRALGQRPMIRKDGQAHAQERKVINPALRPKSMLEHWGEVFRKNAKTTLTELRAVGPVAADLNTHFAAPVAARNLAALVGLPHVPWQDIARWSADFIAGSGNVTEDPDIWARCEKSKTEANDALDEAFVSLRKTPDLSITSLMLQSGMSEQSVKANALLAISGGINEPQHVATGSVYYLDRYPEIRAGINRDPGLWDALFEETVRLLTPIAMLTRQTTADSVVCGYHIPAGSQIGLVLAAANRDPDFVQDPEQFRLDRPVRRHIGFGNGPHMCAGKWAAQTGIGRIAVPMLFEELTGFRVDHSRSTSWGGFIFRGLTNLPVTWDGQ